MNIDHTQTLMIIALMENGGKRMSRLIDADELISRMKLFCYKDCNECGYSTFLSNDEHCGLIDEQPTIEPVKGKWVDKSNEYDSNTYECSICGEPWTLMYGTPEENHMNFCNRCGADMR